VVRDLDEPTSTRSRRLWLVVGALVSIFFLLGWFDRSEVGTFSLGQPDRILLVSDAGTVEVVAGNEAAISHNDSWLFSRPRIESAERSGEAVVRVTCPGHFPCRSTVTLTAPTGVELVVVATNGVVDINRFDGKLTVFSTSNDVVLASSSGSARIFSRNGSVRGFGLGFAEIDVETEDSAVELRYAVAPDSVVIRGDETKIEVALPKARYRVRIDTTSTEVDVGFNSTESSERFIVIRSRGPVRLSTES
jgi:hypothetical protein